MYSDNKTLKAYARSLRNHPTTGEKLLWECLRRKRLNATVSRQKIIGNYIADFYIHKAKLAIEVDGISHQEKKEKDYQRDIYFQSIGIEVVRIDDARVFCNISSVAEEIEQIIQRRLHELQNN